MKDKGSHDAAKLRRRAEEAGGAEDSSALPEVTKTLQRLVHELKSTRSS
jgi:hypothetical protein